MHLTRHQQVPRCTPQFDDGSHCLKWTCYVCSNAIVLESQCTHRPLLLDAISTASRRLPSFSRLCCLWERFRHSTTVLVGKRYANSDAQPLLMRFRLHPRCPSTCCTRTCRNQRPGKTIRLATLPRGAGHTKREKAESLATHTRVYAHTNKHRVSAVWNGKHAGTSQGQRGRQCCRPVSGARTQQNIAH